MYGQFNQTRRVPVRSGLFRFGTNRNWVKSSGPYRCVYRHRNTGTTPEPFSRNFTTQAGERFSFPTAQIHFNQIQKMGGRKGELSGAKS